MTISTQWLQVVTTALNSAKTQADEWEWINTDEVHKNHIHHLDEDALALSVCLHRLREKPHPHAGYMIGKVTSPELVKHINQDDRDKANLIRDYYSKKILWLRLREDKLTHFREDLSTFLVGNGKDVMERMMPMVYRLPELYNYDIEFEKLFGPTTTLAETKEKGSHNEKTKTIKHVKTLHRTMSKRNVVEYWFKDTSNGDPVLLAFAKENPLLNLLDTQLKKELNLHSAFYLARRDGFHFFRANKLLFC